MKKYLLLLVLLFSVSLVGCDFFSQTTTTLQSLTTTTVASTETTPSTTESELTIRLNAIYNLAIESNSFEGTYEEWLETVRGPQGLPGKEVLFQVADGYIQWQYNGDSTWTNLISLSTLTGADGVDGIDGTDGKEVIFQVADGYIQWQYTGDSTWTNLISLSTLTGADGVDGIDGTDGKEVIFQVTDGYIQWQYTGDSTWTNLISLSTLTGADGEDGLSAYEIYLQYHPDYTKTEEEWIYDLINGLLADKLQVTVTFDSLGGTQVDSQIIDKYTIAAEPQDPEKDGYIFKYWEYQSHEWIFFGYLVSQDITIVAHYDIIPYQITYIMTDGATNNENNPVSYNVETDTFSLLDPVKDGFLFTGWTYSGQELPTKSVTIEKGSTGSIEFTAHWYELDTSGYDTELTEEDENGIIDTFYYIEFYDDDTFLLITSNLYYTGTFISNPQFGYLIDLGDNVYELDFIDEGIDSIYILMDEEGIYFCDEFGNLYDPNSGNVGRVDFDGSNVDFTLYGYGYFDLSYQQNYVAKKTMYEELALLCEAFALNTDDISPIMGEYLFNSIDLEAYGLSVEEAISTFKLFLLDHPEVYWLSNTVHISVTEFNVYLQEEYALYSYRLSTNEAIAQMIAEAELLIDENMNELEIALALHDYIILRIEYAYESDGVTPQDDYWAHNIEGVATGIGAVCESYAETYKLLADHFGITSILVTGDSNGQRHMWNIVSIDGIYYHVDVTWDDAGGDTFSYTYFGMSYASISSNHDLDTPFDTGFEYLYQLPLISEDDIALVTLYENEVSQGMFVSIEDAFMEMTDPSADYIIELYNYQLVGPILWSSCVRTYYVPSGELPDVDSIFFRGKHIDFGGGYFTNIILYFTGDTSSNTELIFENIGLYATDYYEININDSTMKFVGYHDQLSEMLTIVGGTGSTVIVDVDYEVESYAEFHVDTMELYFCMVLRGENNSIDTVNGYTNNGYLRIYGSVNSVSIGNLNIYDYNVELIKLDNVESTILTIGNITDYTSSSSYRYIIVRLSDIQYMPTINITGDINCKLQYWFLNSVTYMSTTIDGTEVNRWTVTVDLLDFEDGIIMTAPNLPFENFNFRYSNNYDITELYTMDEYGNIYRDKDFIEVIDGTTLVKVLYLNSNLTNTYVIPDGITTIGTEAFIGFLHLSEVIIPSSVTDIHFYAFAGIYEMKYIHIPSTVITMERYALAYSNATILCDLLTPPPSWDPEWISPYESVVWGYLGSFDNGEFKYAITAFGTVSILGLSPLNENTDIVIPSMIDGFPVTQLVAEAFKNNDKITSIVIPNTITEIPTSAFYRATSLRSVTIEEGSNLVTIGMTAFFYCPSLTEINIPASVTYIGNQAFDYSPLLIIYTPLAEAPSTWDIHWNSLPCPVVWGYIGE